MNPLKRRAEDLAATREVLGYLNFSGGRPDPSFQRLVNDLVERFTWKKLAPTLLKALSQLEQEAPAFEDSRQARAVITLAFEHVLPAYREFHRDLFFHLSDEDFQQPFFLARVWEVLLEQGGPWDESAAIVERTLDRLNDFIGYRPVAVLENGQRMQAYPQERFRPFPLYLQGAGVAAGPFREVISRSLELLRATPEDLLAEAHFTLENMEELALDPRAHDHSHPANKRTNYLFGEWDPHQIDIKGRYRRFIIRKVILDALEQWISEQKRVSMEEVLFDAAAVLGGTILMASAISGAGPGTHDSTVSLTTLLPRVARQRDAFYARLMAVATGARAKRLNKHAETTQQPFGHVRQYLNFYLAQYGTQQVQRRHVAYLYARMARPDAARKQAAIIPSASARFESEIQWRFAAIKQAVDRGQVNEAVTLLGEAEDLLHRGIACGALVDPWNILGFQGQFPLFTTREDSVPDQRIEVLLLLVEGILESYTRVLEEAAARAMTLIVTDIDRRYERFADFWDRFGSVAVQDLPTVLAQDHLDSARRVARALAEWRAAGEAAGQIPFWREHVAEFQTARAYAQVVSALLDRKDLVASLGLLMQWLSQADDVGLVAGPLSFDRLLNRWSDSLADLAHTERTQAKTGEESQVWPLLRRLFAYLEANAGDYWLVPSFGEASVGTAGPEAGPPSDEDDDPDRELYGAAYEGVTFRDSADDGTFSDTADERGGLPDAGEFEVFERLLEPRLQFLRMLARLWQAAASVCGRSAAEQMLPPEAGEHLRGWLGRVNEVQRDLERLCNELWERELSAPVGDHDANVEYDAQLQTKLYLVQVTLATIVSFRTAQWVLWAALPEAPPKGDHGPVEASSLALFRHLVRGDSAEVRKALPGLLRSLKKEPLLYVPLDHGGAPPQILAARTMQALMRFLLRHLPKLGLLRETWHVLKTAQYMERNSRPQGLAVTEYDRLFRIALKSSLEAIIQASGRWKSGKFTDEELIEFVGTIVELYLDQWLEHSGTMRLSSVEALKLDGVWDETKKFIQQYGGELFHARQLTLGNVRAILHQGVDRFLDYLAENEDPLHPLKLLADLESGEIAREDAVDHLRLIYQIVVERYDRFLEYNTTTTQSDYGEVFHSLLDFLRLETTYDRDAWNLVPVSLAHEVLSRMGKDDAAQIWEDVFATKTEDMADRHLAELTRLERQYGMRLPSISNHLRERFVKPLSVNTMVALLGPACAPAVPTTETAPKSRGATSHKPDPFRLLQKLVDEYLKSTSGSGLEVPPWLRQLEDELNRVQDSDLATGSLDLDADLDLPPCLLNLRETKQQLRQWRDPLTGRKRKPGS